MRHVNNAANAKAGNRTISFENSQPREGPTNQAFSDVISRLCLHLFSFLSTKPPFSYRHRSQSHGAVRLPTPRGRLLNMLNLVVFKDTVTVDQKPPDTSLRVRAK
jgi:hypothetical protein